MWSGIGWIAWVVAAFLALSFAYGCRTSAATRQGVSPPTAVRTFFWWLIAALFLVAPFNKLHIIWLIPLGYFASSFLILPGVPVVSPVVIFLTRAVLSFILVGVRFPEQDFTSRYMMKHRLRSDRKLIEHLGGKSDSPAPPDAAQHGTPSQTPTPTHATAGGEHRQAAGVTGERYGRNWDDLNAQWQTAIRRGLCPRCALPTLETLPREFHCKKCDARFPLIQTAKAKRSTR
jgi:hypothetical protein